ncbi:hypothetical protein COLU111180_03375 [Cohnella lubricantis]|uniref:Capsular biosynthesis protein n=1 Tax=Cohnella lubricantis TaxID=2163172 RepID=A0A841TBD7_9BACL|nr:hypothetical protein [Cohnella lubricantis]MBB6678783.1 hypothetical protein [Cohnella lubricantis]MBP2117866.1 hypothetical protein [Cohnella lubricantis]
MADQKNLHFIFDDRFHPSSSISNVVGNSTFGEILHKRTKLSNKIKELLFEMTDIPVDNFYLIRDIADIENLRQTIKETSRHSIFVHFMSYAVIINEDHFLLALKKAMYIDTIMTIHQNDPLIYYFPEGSGYLNFLDHVSTRGNVFYPSNFEEESVLKPNDFVVDISKLQNFLQFFSGGFEARHFNALKGDLFTLTKTSSDRSKMRKEHDYYHLLPPEMKGWFVAPYNFTNNERVASYTMERLNIPDMALQWIHGAISPNDLATFLDKVFFFITHRPRRSVSKDSYIKSQNDLYYTKVLERINTLKQLPEYSRLHMLIETGTSYNSIDEVFADYNVLYNKYASYNQEFYEVIGHGDLCFSNILYDKSTNLMKFIDPKGAVQEEDLWVNPYYDLAKLSHSIFGNYDYINNEMFTVSLDSNCGFHLDIEIKELTTSQAVFRDKLEQYGIDIFIVRLFEASLFLSMLPLHIDNPRKVFAFVLNAIHIIEELKNNGK